MEEESSVEDPLAALIVDGEELDKERIVRALSGIAGLSRSGAVVQLDRFSVLTARQKILTYLLAYKAADILGLRDGHSIGSADLARSIGLAEGTVYPTVSQLRGDRVISQDSNAKCFIGHHQVAPATAEILAAGTEGPAPQPRRTTRKKTSGSGPRRNPSPLPVDGGESAKPEEAAPPPTASTGATGSKASGQKSANGFKPSDAVRAMISDGFFDEPRDLASVRGHLKDEAARDVPVTTLSPLFTRLLRTGDLRRKKNADGKYEYFVPGSEG